MAYNPKNNFRIVKADPVIVAFTVFDWKWLSNFKPLTVSVTNEQQLVGLENATLVIDFSALELSDSNQDS